jgi:hypothetical protein
MTAYDSLGGFGKFCAIRTPPGLLPYLDAKCAELAITVPRPMPIRRTTDPGIVHCPRLGPTRRRLLCVSPAADEELADIPGHKVILLAINCSVDIGVWMLKSKLGPAEPTITHITSSFAKRITFFSLALSIALAWAPLAADYYVYLPPQMKLLSPPSRISPASVATRQL